MKHSAVSMGLVIAMALLAGCDKEKESYSRYPSVHVPEFKTDDYADQLSDENPEVVYNAVCNLGNNARYLGNTLWGEKADPTSDHWMSAQAVYTNICGQLQSEYTMVVAASLRFLQLFAHGHENRSELVEPVCRITDTDPLVQFEQIVLLEILVDSTTQVPVPLLERLLNSPSWLVSRRAYGLIGALSDETMRAELLTRYRAADEKPERLLLLSAYGKSSDSRVLEFLMQEMLSTDDDGIRQIAFSKLLKQIENPAVLAWMRDHAAELDEKEQKALLDAAASLPFADDAAADFPITLAEDYFELVRTLLSVGYVPEDENLNEILAAEYMISTAYSAELSEEMDITEEEVEQIAAYYDTLNHILKESPAVAARMEELREVQVDHRRRCQAAEEEFAPVIEKFMEEARIILSRNEVPDDKQQKFLKPIANLNMENIIPANP